MVGGGGSITRRNWLGRGAVVAGALALGRLERASAGEASSRHKAVINIFLVGGPSHIDTFDLKPDAPAEIRGDFRPIATNVPGLSICDHLPGLAQRMDRFAVVRSLQGGVEQHLSDLCMSGWPMSADGQRQGGRPAMGPVAGHLLGAVDPAVPPFVRFGPSVGTIGSNVGEPGFLPGGCGAFRPDGASAEVLGMPGLSLERMGGRAGLLSEIEGARRWVDRSGSMDAFDEHTRRAFSMLTSKKVADALDLSREDPGLVEKYGRGDPPAAGEYAPFYMDQFLVARRLVEAGVRVVTVPFGLWDTHSDQFTDKRGHGSRYSLPRLDQGLSALIDDLHDRGLEKDVAVVAWGEFGRTPRINKDGGRDHWPAVSMAILAGGGFRTGQLIGTTDKWAARVASRPYHYQNVFATLYRHLGIDPETTMLEDRVGRPTFLLEKREVIRELVG